MREGEKRVPKGVAQHLPLLKRTNVQDKKGLKHTRRTYSNELKMASKKLQNKAANLRKKEHVETKRKKQKASKNGKGNRRMQSIKK
ncbi:hypothetical protein [Shuttleworthella satelles]|uniref:Uncharacterized protein n=1 Tax=Shuttleworthella satelles DSM 14600 TaxID=626523 RepID=C4GBK6_9FIRM|nr:hypothetical protein [Shuttleworthia satelles]EEP28499.1 hypothetical protein GCWU000342_01309 [Shuttleworthia satelles DSM 14600]